jgi:hypothetical protein
LRTEKTLKGDIGTTQVIADLSKKGYVILTPVVCESLPFDIVAFKDGEFKRIQCKYSADGTARKSTTYSDRRGNHRKNYNDSDFDYYGIYLPDLDKVVYPSIKFKGATIATEVRNSATPFYWWEDFTEFTDVANKKTYKDFGKTVTQMVTQNVIESRLKKRKAERPSKEDLKKLLWEIPTQKLAETYGVSDVAISKWAKSYGIDKPPRGYWAKKYSEGK